MEITKKRSLIVAPQWIGDAVMTEPLLRRLHAQGERLTVGALPWVAPVYRAMPQVSEVIEFPFAHGGLQWGARRALARQVQGQFDTAYILPNSLKSALLPWLADIPKRVGYLGEARVGLLTHRLKNPAKDKRPPMVAFYSALAGEVVPPRSCTACHSLPPEGTGLAWGGPALRPSPDIAQDQPHLQIPAERVHGTLATLGLADTPYVLFAPGAEFGPAKRWPAAHFAQLARELQQTVVLVGSAKEAALCAEIAQQGGPLCRSLAGSTTLEQAMHLIAGAQSVVSNDSGLMHVAAALGRPQVAIFGSSSPLHTPPLNPAAHVLWLKSDASYQPPLDCAPCFQRDCPLADAGAHLRCLRDISPAAVLQRLPTEAQR